MSKVHQAFVSYKGKIPDTATLAAFDNDYAANAESKFSPFTGAAAKASSQSTTIVAADFNDLATVGTCPKCSSIHRADAATAQAMIDQACAGFHCIDCATVVPLSVNTKELVSILARLDQADDGAGTDGTETPNPDATKVDIVKKDDVNNDADGGVLNGNGNGGNEQPTNDAPEQTVDPNVEADAKAMTAAFIAGKVSVTKVADAIRGGKYPDAALADLLANDEKISATDMATLYDAYIDNAGADFSDIADDSGDDSVDSQNDGGDDDSSEGGDMDGDGDADIIDDTDGDDSDDGDDVNSDDDSGDDGDDDSFGGDDDSSDGDGDVDVIDDSDDGDDNDGSGNSNVTDDSNGGGDSSGGDNTGNGDGTGGDGIVSDNTGAGDAVNSDGSDDDDDVDKDAAFTVSFGKNGVTISTKGKTKIAGKQVKLKDVASKLTDVGAVVDTSDLFSGEDDNKDGDKTFADIKAIATGEQPETDKATVLTLDGNVDWKNADLSSTLNANKTAYVVFANDVPVGILQREKAHADNAKFFETDVFPNAFARQVREGKDVKRFGYAPFAVRVDTAAIAKTISDKQLSDTAASISNDYDKKIGVIKDSIVTATVAANKGVWDGYSNPVKEALVKKFTSLGHEDAASIIEGIFADNAQAATEAMLTKAFELAAKSDVARTEITEMVNTAKYALTVNAPITKKLTRMGEFEKLPEQRDTAKTHTQNSKSGSARDYWNEAF
jgi:hypothetical protein